MMVRNPILGNSLEAAKRVSTKVIMNTKLYVGNLTFDALENELQDLFAQHGPVTEVNLMQDRVTGKARGFAFVTMETKEGADAAIQALNGKDWKGRALTVNEARPREARTAGGGGYRGGGYGGGHRPNRY
jgi:cold-inducible RNA-binding protein